MKKILLIILSVLLFLGTVYTSAFALNVGYINNGGGDVNYLTNFGHSVTYIDNPVSLTAGDLAGYDAVMVTSNSAFSDSSGVGNALADYADLGGGVVLTEFCFQGWWALEGRIMTPGYSPFGIDPGSTGYPIYNHLGSVYDASSPLFDGVTIGIVATQYQADMAVTIGASLIADWTSGRHAFAYNILADSKVVGLNLFPAETSTNDLDTQRLISNALIFSTNGGGSPVPEPVTMLLVGFGLLGLAGLRRKFRK